MEILVRGRDIISVPRLSMDCPQCHREGEWYMAHGGGMFLSINHT